MTTSGSWLSYYYSGTSKEKVVALLNEKIIYLEGAYVALGGVSCLTSGSITRESTLCGIIENIIIGCRSLQDAVLPLSDDIEPEWILRDTHYVAYYLQEFVKLTKPGITHAVLNEQLKIIFSILTNN